VVYDPRLCNQWQADSFKKSVIASVTVISESRSLDGFEGKYVDPQYIRKCVLENVLDTAYQAGVA
jgi:hypothetical protein